MKPRRPQDARYAKVLLHGAPNAGKTFFLGTAQEDPRTFPMAVVNWDGGDSTLAGLDIDVFDIRDSKDFDEVFKDLSHKDAPWNSYGVDSVSEAQINIIDEIISRGMPGMGEDELGQQGWGLVLTKSRRLARRFFKNLDMHGFMTAHSMDRTVARVGSVKAPKVQGQFADELPGIPEVVAYMAQEDVEPDEAHPEGVQRIMLLRDYPKFSVKARTPWGMQIPQEIVDPDVTKLLDALGYPAPGKQK